jgi:hypothetical protein
MPVMVSGATEELVAEGTEIVLTRGITGTELIATTTIAFTPRTVIAATVIAPTARTACAARFDIEVVKLETLACGLPGARL